MCCGACVPNIRRLSCAFCDIASVWIEHECVPQVHASERLRAPPLGHPLDAHGSPRLPRHPRTTPHCRRRHRGLRDRRGAPQHALRQDRNLEGVRARAAHVRRAHVQEAGNPRLSSGRAARVRHRLPSSLDRRRGGRLLPPPPRPCTTRCPSAPRKRPAVPTPSRRPRPRRPRRRPRPRRRRATPSAAGRAAATRPRRARGPRRAA